MKFEDMNMKMDDLTIEQKLELNYKSQLYGVAYAVKDKDGNVKIFGLNEDK